MSATEELQKARWRKMAALRDELLGLMAEEAKEWRDECVALVTVRIPSTATDEEMLVALADELKRIGDRAKENPQIIPFATTVRRHIKVPEIDHVDDAYLMEPDMEQTKFDGDRIVPGGAVFWRKPSREFGRR